MANNSSDITKAVADVEAASQTIVQAARKLIEAGKTIDLNSTDLEQDLILKLHKKVSEAKDLTAQLDYIEPSSSSCTC